MFCTPVDLQRMLLCVCIQRAYGAHDYDFSDMALFVRAVLPVTYTEVQDIDDPFSTQIQMVSAYAQSNAEFMREMEV